MFAKSFLACLGLAVFVPHAATAQNDSPPAVTSSWINAGTPQRSMIQSIGVRFERNVSNLVNQDSLKVRNIATGNMVDLSGATLIYDPRNNSANWMIDKDRSALLPDGNYLAWIEIDSMLDERLRDMNAAAGVPIDDYTFGFHQYSGDTDGDRDVDFRDASVLRDSWQQSLGQKKFRSFLDFDLSDLVNEGDRGTVNSTYFSVLPAAPAIHLFLRNDTGEDTTDNITGLYASAFGSTGTSDAVAWRARLGGGVPADITPVVAHGSGALDAALIDQLNGGALIPGRYSLTVEALDASDTVLAADTLDFEYSGRPTYRPHFISTPPPGVALGQVQAAQPLNLANWTRQQWPFSPPSSWVTAPDGLSVRQIVNSGPSALISDQSFLNLRITGSFRVDTAGDDDLMGFVFGYQNSNQFYVFDWKQGSQGSLGGTALRGMCIKRFDAGSGEFTEADFWWSNANRPNMTILSPPNDIPWEDFQEYKITLDFTPGRILIEVRKDDGTLLDRLEVNDSTFTGGRFGFYNYSQDQVVYSGFAQEALNNIYFYDAEAVDPDGGAIIYSIDQAPPGATIHASTGALMWQPETPGSYPFRIVATDPDGLTGVQEFDVSVSPIDEPPTVYISKTAPSVYPGDPISFRVTANDDQQIQRIRLFIDDFEVGLDELGSYTTTFAAIGLVELKAIAIDSAGQTSSISSFVRVLDPSAPPSDNSNSTVIVPDGQTTGNPSDLRPLVSFQSPLQPGDDPTQFTGTVSSNGGTLSKWVFEWAPARTVNFSNLASPAVLWQTITEGTSPVSSGLLATITPANFPNEIIAFRLRGENTNGLGALTSVVFNPRSTNLAGPGATTGSGGGPSALASFTSPLSVSDDPTAIRGTVNANGGTLQSWVLDSAPRNAVDTANLSDPSVTWTILSQGTAPATNALLATINPATFTDQTHVFRLTAINTNGRGTVATLIYNPVANGFNGPNGSTGTPPATNHRPVTRITSPTAAGHDRTVLKGTVNENGGTLERWVVDYAPRVQVNANDLNDPTVSWTELATGTVAKSDEDLAPLTDPAFQTGLWIIRLRAFNTNGLGSLASIQLDPGDTSLPSVTILSPEGEDSIGYITDVRGTVSAGSGNLASWKLEIAPSEEVSLVNLNATANWVELGSGTSAIADQVLGKIDPTTLRNGSYVLRLKAMNTNGRGLADGILIHISGEAKLGNFRLEFEDLNLPLAEIPIRITRIYDTLNANQSGDFGYGWSLGIGNPDLRETVPDTGDSYFFATPFEIGTRVFLTTPEGRRVGFTFNVRNPRNRFLYVDYEPYFEPDPGVYETLTIAPSDYERVEVDAAGAVYTPLLPFGYNPDRYRLTTKDGLVYDYDQRLGLQKITGRNGQSVSFTRNAITHSSGLSVTLTRDAKNRITTITTPAGIAKSYRYDANGDLVAIEEPTGEATVLSYLRNPAHYLDKVASPQDAALGRYTRRIIYENGRVARVEDADGNPVAHQSVAPGDFTGTRTDALGNVTTLIYDRRGNITRETSPEGAVTTIEYGDAANPDKETLLIDPNGNRTEYQYDARGNVVMEKDHAGNVRRQGYDTSNRLTSVVFEDGAGGTKYSIAFEYDAKGNVTKYTESGGRERLFEYDAQGRVIKKTEPDGEIVSFVYNGSQQGDLPSRVIRGDGEEMVYDYNSLGLATKVTGNGKSLDFTYDTKGQLIRMSDSRGNAEIYEYDLNGRLIRKTDGEGRIVEFTYNTAGQATSEIRKPSAAAPQPQWVVTNISYDAVGNMLSYTDGEGLHYATEYDADGRVTRRTSPGGAATAYLRDANGNITQITDRLGRQRTFEYDHRNALIRESWLNTSGGAIKSIQYTYGALGELLTTTDGEISYSMTYDSYGSLATVDNAGSSFLPHLRIQIGKDANGRIASVEDQLGVNRSLTYASCCQPGTLSWSGAPGVTAGVRISRDNIGSIIRIDRFADNLLSVFAGSTEYTRDPLDGAVDTIRHIGPDSSLLPGGWEFTYTRNSSRQVTGATGMGSSASFAYDGSGQVISANRTGATSLPDETYNYNHSGNRISSHLGGATSYNALGLPVSNGKYTYDYDDERNLIMRTDIVSGNRLKFYYDHRNRPVRMLAETSTGNLLSSHEFTYDPFDRVVRRDLDGAVSYTGYFQENPWADFSATGEVTARYLHDDRTDGLLARWTPTNGVEWILNDHRNSIRGLANNSGAITASIDYDSFGNAETTNTLPDNMRFSFTGRERIAEGIYHFRARLYDAFAGRFLSDDPEGPSAGDPNLQRYVFNDPLNLIDPSGRSGVDANLPSLTVGQSISLTLKANAIFTAKAVAVGAVTGAVVTPILDLVCLFFTDDLGKASFQRFGQKMGVGASIGAGVGLAWGASVFFGNAFSMPLGGAIGNFATQADVLIKVPWISLATSGLTLLKARTGKDFDCDSPFYSF